MATIPNTRTVSTPSGVPVADGSGKIDDAWLTTAILRASRMLTAGTGLTGGGDLTADRTFAVDFGTGSGKVCQGNDSRLSDARTPTTHASSHGSAGSDPITIALSQITGTASRAVEVSAGGTLQVSATTAAEIAYLAGITPGTATGSKSPVLDSSRNISNLNTVGVAALNSSGTCTITNNAGFSGWWARSYSSNVFQASGNNFFRAGGTSGSPTATPNTAFIGLLNFRGHDGTAFFADDNARIAAIAAELHSSTVAGTSLIFYSTPAGSKVLTESLRCVGVNVGIGLTSDPTSSFDVGGNTIRLRTSRTPASATATGNSGEICRDSLCLYLCTATNTWIRTAFYTASSPAQLTANADNYAPTETAIWRMSTDASRDLTGINVSQWGGDEHQIWNVGSNNLVIKHQSTNSTAAYRFISFTGTDITLAANEGCSLTYDATSLRWRVSKL